MPELQELNRLPMHGAEIPFHDRETALTGEWKKSKYFRLLDGQWDFRLYRCPEAVPADFAAENFSDPEIFKLQVPSNWTLAGLWDKPVYTNIQMPFLENFELPEENPTGIYRKTFSVPASWLKRRTVLHIGGAESYLEVYLNGTFVGMGKDTRLPSEFDLTPYLKKGGNLLVCKVIRWSDSSFIEDQDQWWMAGIYRSVWLYNTGFSFIEDLYVNGDFDYENGKGLLHIENKSGFYSPAWSSKGPRDPMKLHLTLYDRCNEVLWDKEEVVSPLFRDEGYCTAIDAVFDNIQPWSAESPELYTLIVEFLDKGGKLLDCRRKRLGFRNIRIEGRDLLFNGKRVFIRGVNRHEHNMLTGKTLSLEDMLSDIKMMKQYNFNAVRTSHYPNDHRWYGLCDEYGIYVVDEANAESHALYHLLCRDPRWKNAFVSRGERMVLRDRSFTSIFCWSTGNESGNGENHIAEIRAMKALDPTRLIHHEGEVKKFWHQGANVMHSKMKWMNNFYDPMYPAPSELAEYSADPETDRPMIMSEYAHAMGNSSGSLCDYWDLIFSKTGLQGGFIWDWIDQGLLVKREDGKEMMAYGGDFGEKRHDFDFCCNGMISSDHRPHPGMFEFRHLVQPVKISWHDPEKLSFKLTNRRDFTTLQDLAGVWKMEVDGNIVLSGKIPDFSTVAPGESMDFLLPLKAGFSGREAFVTFEFYLAENKSWASAGTLIAHDQLELTGKIRLEFPAAKKSVTRPEIIEKDDTLTLVNGKTSIIINRKDGTGVMKRSGKIILTKLFECNLFRAGTDNDGIRGWTGQEHKPLAKWLNAGLDHLETIDCRMTFSGEQLRIAGKLTGRDPGAKISFIRKIKMLPDGSFCFIQEYKLPEKFPAMPRIGVTAMTAAGFEKAGWFGRGPWENYSDRKRSAHVGRYEASVSELHEDTYVLPQENGNRCDVRSLTLKSKKNTLHISAEIPFEFSVSHYTANDLYETLHQCDLVPRKETVINIDLAQRGVGTGSCGPQTLEQYELNEKNYRFEFTVFAE